ncbi:MAG: hypothetical protein AB7U73_21460 [Pirellulales bacterium]
MPALTSRAELFEREFLGLRAKILEIAATLDRLDRAAGSLAGEPRVEQVREAFALLSTPESDRAERVQLVFSRPYDPNWKVNFDLP